MLAQRFRPRHAVQRLAALAVLTVCAGNAFAQSQIFVIISDDKELPDLQAIISQVKVPVHVLNVGDLPRMTDQIKNELKFIEDLSIDEVRAREFELEVLFNRTVTNRQSDFGSVYRSSTLAGEISARYGVTTTPSLVEIDARGRYRLVEEPDNLEQGIIALETTPLQRAPPRLGRSTPAGAGLDIEFKGGTNELITLVVDQGEFTVPRDHLFPKTSKNSHIDLVPLDDTGARYRVANQDSVGDLSGVNLIPTAQAQTTSSLASEPRVGRASATFRNTDGATEVEPVADNAAFGPGGGYSALDSIIDGSTPDSFDCLDLRITGVCTYIVVRVYCLLLCTVEVTPEASMQLSHYNPELLVASYKRLGGSPLQEARALFGQLQLSVTGITMPAITGQSMPDEYDNEELWAAAGSDQASSVTSSTQKYHEVDVIGHAGSLFSWVSADNLNPFDDFIEDLTGVTVNISEGVSEAVNQLPAVLQGSFDVVTAEATANPDPIRLVQEDDPDTFFDRMERPSGTEIMAIINSQFPSGIADAAGAMLGLFDEYAGIMSIYDSATEIATNSISENISQVTDVDFEGALEEIDLITETIGGVTEGFRTLGVGDEGTEIFSMCPKSSRFMKPYLLSGLDMIQWKFNLPEIIYPETYAPPLPAFQDLYVGSGVLNNWGSIYPRQGFSTQPDDGKAAAVTAARAVHVVTREDESHIYSYLEPYKEKYLDISPAPAFNPKVVETGKWQPLSPEVDAMCHVFGDEDFPHNPWTEDRQTADKSYVYAYWREATCCPEPRRGGAVAMVATPITKIRIEDIEVIN